MDAIRVKIDFSCSIGELKVIDTIVGQEKIKAKAVKPGKQFSRYIKKITKGNTS